MPLSSLLTALAAEPAAIVLGAMLLAAALLAASRYAAIGRAFRADPTFMKRVRDYVHDGELDSAKLLCKKSATAPARVVYKGLCRIDRSMAEVAIALDGVAAYEAASLRRGLPWLALLGAAAPLTGLLGAAAATAKALGAEFAGDALAGPDALANLAAAAEALAGPLSVAAAGMALGIVVMLAYTALTARVNRAVRILEKTKIEFMDLLNEPSN